MFKFIAFIAFFALATAAPGFIQQQHVITPLVANVGAVDHTAPSAVSHQSFSQVHSNAHIVTPIVKAVAPVPVVKTLHASPVVPVVKTFAAPVHHVPVPVPLVKSFAPVLPLRAIVAAPVAHYVHH